jgi:hypothetical protein
MRKITPKLYKWQQAYIDDIKSCNTKSPDREKRMLKDYEEKGYCEIEMWCLAVPVARFILPRLKDFRGIVKRDTNRANNYSATLKDFDAMIYSFEKIAKDDHMYVTEEVRLKIQNGLQLFATHLTGMWC